MRNSKSKVLIRRACRLLLIPALCLGLAAQVGLGMATGVALAGSARADVKALAPVEGPEGEAFYTPPSPLPDGKPGDVIWYQKGDPVKTQAFKAMGSGAVWRVMYLSTNALERPDAVTGLILLPSKGDPATMPVVGFAPGTHGVADKCAMSRKGATWTDYETLAVTGLLSRGWAVALTDYEGLGTPGMHTYMIGRTQGAALLDVVRAARQLPVAGLSTSSPVALYGYSQGGGATGWAVEMQPSYAPELPLRGAAAGGVPADLDVVAKKLNGGLGFAFLSMASLGLDAAYPELKLNSYLNGTGKVGMGLISNQLCMIPALTLFAGKKITDYTTKNPLDTPEWQARVKEQRLGGKSPGVPVFLGHGRQDEFIPFTQAVQLRQDWCSAGATVEWHDYLGEHLTTLARMQGAAMNYLADRIAGKPAKSTC